MMALVADLLVILVSVFVLVQHAFALKGHFVAGKMQPGALAITGTAAVMALGFALLGVQEAQPLWAQVLGLIIELLSLWLFRAAIAASKSAQLHFAFDPAHPHSLVAEGPYRVVRHPFYTSYLLFWIGWTIAVWTFWALVPFFVLAALYLGAARMEEANFLASPLADDYRAYKKRAGLFWPVFGPARAEAE